MWQNNRTVSQIYETTPLKVKGRDAEQSHFGMSTICKTRPYDSTFLSWQLFHVSVKVNNPNAEIHVYWNGTIKKRWKPFSCWMWEFTDKQATEARVIHIAMGKRWRHQNEIMFCLIQRVTYRNIYRYVHIYQLVYTHVFPCPVSWEGLEETTPQ